MLANILNDMMNDLSRQYMSNIFQKYDIQQGEQCAKACKDKQNLAITFNLNITLNLYL